MCNSVFSRKEHLLRHHRNRRLRNQQHLAIYQNSYICHLDTEEAPFQCTVCGKCFKRQDVLHRHCRDLCNQMDVQETISPQQYSSKRRTAKACDGCRLQKLKCNGAVPCQRCIRRSVDCSYAASTYNTRSWELPSALAVEDILALTTSDRMASPNIHLPDQHSLHSSAPSISAVPMGEVGQEVEDSTMSLNKVLPPSDERAGIDMEFLQSFGPIDLPFDLDSFELWPAINEVLASLALCHISQLTSAATRSFLPRFRLCTCRGRPRS